jgi:hypothetical protein
MSRHRNLMLIGSVDFAFRHPFCFCTACNFWALKAEKLNMLTTTTTLCSGLVWSSCDYQNVLKTWNSFLKSCRRKPFDDLWRQT